MATVGCLSGTELARAHDGDAWAAAEAVGAIIEWGNASAMRRRGRDGLSIRNPHDPDGPHLIVVADDLDRPDLRFVLAHEIKHLLDPAATEPDCDRFAAEFVRASRSPHRRKVNL